MKKKEDVALCCLSTAMLLLASTGLGADQSDSSRQDLLDCPVCTAAVNNYDFQLVKQVMTASCLRQKAIKAGPDTLLFIQGRYNN